MVNKLLSSLIEHLHGPLPLDRIAQLLPYSLLARRLIDTDNRAVERRVPVCLARLPYVAFAGKMPDVWRTS
jgi:hypothetical protein